MMFSTMIDSHSTRATDVITALELEPHVEGGYFQRTYTATPRVTTSAGERPAMSAIYYLLTDTSPVGHWHRNRSDILHCWHAGRPLRYSLLDPDGELNRIWLGPDLNAGERPQLLVPGGVWKATELLPDTGAADFGLLSEAVSPGFDYADMELARGLELQRAYPHLWPHIAHLCSPETKHDSE